MRAMAVVLALASAGLAGCFVSKGPLIAANQVMARTLLVSLAMTLPVLLDNQRLQRCNIESIEIWQNSGNHGRSMPHKR